MTKKAMMILDDMIKEYELLAKYNGGKDYERYSVLCDICKELKEKEELKHAEWLGIDYDGYANGQPVIELWECSNCGYEHKGDYTTLTNYCPHCGAKMESEDKDGKK